MSDALAFGPAPKPRFGLFKKHRIITWIIAFVMTVTSAAFAAWVVSNTLTTQQNSKAKIGSAGNLTNITTTLPADAEVASTCPAPDPTVPANTNCSLTLRVINNSGTNAVITKLTWDTNGTASVTHSAGPICAGSYTTLASQPGSTANFIVAGALVSGTPIAQYTLNGPIPPIPVPQGDSIVVVPNAFGINPNGVNGNDCADSAVSFDGAIHTVTFQAAP